MASTREGRWMRKLEALKLGGTLADPTVPGLRARCRTGGMFFELRYKEPGSGRWKSMPVGKLSPKLWRDADGALTIEPGTKPLLLIRAKARELAQKVEASVDPRSELGPDGIGLGAALDRYEKSLEARSVVKRSEYLSLLRRELAEPLGSHRALGTLDRALLVTRINAVKDSGRAGAAKELRTRAGVFLNWAADEGLIPANPLAGWKRPRRTRAQMMDTEQAGRALADDEIGPLWRAAEAFGHPFGPYLQFLLLTGQRRTETTLARWDNIDGAVWLIPKEITKSGRAHRVPLPPLALDVLPARSNSSPLLFRGRGDAPMTGHSPLLRRFRKDNPKLPHFTLHDLRRTVKSGLAALGVEPIVSELMLNHALADALEAAYNKHDYWPERVEAAQRWADHVASQITRKAARQSEAA